MRSQKFQPSNMRSRLEAKINAAGGWVNAHAHLDRAYTITSETFPQSLYHLHQKWTLVNELKKRSTINDIYDRMAYALENMISQGVAAIGTFIDVDELIKDKAMRAADKVREKYKREIKIKFINGSTYKGLLDKEQRKWFDSGAEFADIIGGLPAKDKGNEGKHIEIVLDKARRMKKMAHLHVDQLNTSKETETELLAQKTIENKMQGMVVAIHGISIGAHKKEYRQRVYEKMRKAKLSVISCPTAWIDSPRSEELAPIHNSITPVDELNPAEITVALGTDNIADIYKPFTDGNMWMELRLLMEACDYMNIEDLVKISTSNGLKVLGIK